MGSVHGADPLEPPNHLVHMGAEYATIGVYFIKDDKAEIPEQGFPGRVVGQDAPVEHVGVGEQDLWRMASDLLSPVGRGVAVVNFGRQAFPHPQTIDPVDQGLELILFKRLQRKKVEGLRLRVFEDLLKYGKVVNETFPACRGSGHDNAFSFPEVLNGLHLMGVKFFQSQPIE